MPDAVITEGGAMCYGMTGQSFWLVSKQADGTWKLILNEVAIPTFLQRRAAPGIAGGWPDVELGGPGFCFPSLALERPRLCAEPLPVRGQGLPPCAVERRPIGLVLGSHRTGALTGPSRRGHSRQHGNYAAPALHQ
ncbi:MAG: hypothetical protein QM762_04830 [Chryseolinea sp.]